MAKAIAHNARGQQKTTKVEKKLDGLIPGGVYAYGELLLLGYKDYQIQQLRNKIKIIGKIPKRV